MDAGDSVEVSLERFFKVFHEFKAMESQRSWQDETRHLMNATHQYARSYEGQRRLATGWGIFWLSIQFIIAIDEAFKTFDYVRQDVLSETKAFLKDIEQNWEHMHENPRWAMKWV